MVNVSLDFRFLYSTSEKNSLLTDNTTDFSDEDPSNQQLQYPNQIGELLDGNNATMPAVMGLVLTAPPATHSLDLIGAYNAIERNARPLPIKYFGNLEKSEDAFIPDKPISYDDIESKWANPDLGVNSAQKAADIWCKRFGWIDKTNKSGDGLIIKRPANSALSMNAQVPNNLVKSLDEFYLSPPVMTVA
jgi:hypothetical protein